MPRKQAKIRPAVGSDHDDIARVWDAGWISTGVVSPVQLPHSDLVEKLRTEIENGADLFAIETDDDISGMILTKPALRELSQLFLAPHAQAQGIGSICLDFVKQQFQDGFSLTVAEANVKAIRFYESNGLAFEARVHRPEYQRFDLRYRWRPGA